jgi:hypothetical protein
MYRMKLPEFALWTGNSRVLIAGLVAAVTFFAGASALPEVGDHPIPAANEVAMMPGSTITATTSLGTISIQAGKGLKRSYTWDGSTRSVEMVPRDKRWYGSLGLYFPGPGNHWKPNNGITRGVVEEGQQHFKTVDEAMKWINEHLWMPLVYRNDGLAVGWRKVPERSQLNVDVWQIYIDGKKPTALPGSADEKIIVKRADAG